MSPVLFFVLLVLLAEMLGISAVVMIVIWATKYFAGFKWDGSAQEFNLHPVLMIIGFVFFYGNSILLYRVGAGTSISKFTLKILHFLFHLIAFVSAIIALKAVFDFHNHNNIPNLYSLHSWIGLATVVLFGSQLLCGFLFFLYPRPREEVRKAYKFPHVFFGIFILGMVTAAVLTGLTEKLLFAVKDYSAYPPVGIHANVLGVIVVAFVGVVTFIVTNEKFQFSAPRDNYGQINTN